MRYLGSKDETADVATQSDVGGGGGGGSPLAAWPVGSIFLSTVPTNPNTLLEGGTWVAWGTGRVPIAIDTSQAEFDVVEETGGAKTVSLSVANIPSHTHSMDHDHPTSSTTVNGLHLHEPAYMRSAGGQGSQNRAMAGAGTSTLIPPLNTSNDGSHSHSSDTPYRYQDTGYTGSGTAIPNLPPYIVCYMWKRTA